MDVSSKRPVGWFRGPVTSNSAVGVYGLVTTMVAVLLTYPIVATTSVVVLFLSTTTIAPLSADVRLATWTVPDMVVSRTLRESGG